MELLRIMPVGDSITRGSLLASYEDGPYAGQPVGLPHPSGGGWRATLQQLLRQRGVRFTFCGDLAYGALGDEAGQVLPDFGPRHHGLAGFTNQLILEGGVVPTESDVLGAEGITEVRVPDIATALNKHKPNVVLLMSGTNGFDAEARDRLIRTILTQLDGRLLVATIPPQAPPRAGWEQVDAYNASLPATVATLQAGGSAVSLVDIHALLDVETDLLSDGVHPNADGMRKMAQGWFEALMREVV